MDVRRRLQKNKLNNDIRDTEILIKRSEETIKRLHYSQMGEVYVKAQIAKLKVSIEEKTELLVKLNIDVNRVDKGELDNEINIEYTESDKKVKSATQATKKISAAKKEESNEKKEVSNEYWQGILSASRTQRQKERDIKYARKYFYKIIDTLPPYMQNNLAEMPNNKGYIWRDMHFYGNLPAEPGPQIMFEKQRGGNLIIHEHTDNEYRRYEKQGKNRKQLVHKSNRRKINVGVSIMDYVKK